MSDPHVPVARLPSDGPLATFDREWRALAARRAWSVAASERWLTDLRHRHSEPHRYYHGVAHITDLLDRIRTLPFAQPDEAAAAAFLHDAIHHVGASDNEARSAELAREVLIELDEPNLAERVAAICMATATHAATGDNDTDLFLDADMAVLGDPPSRYARYRAAVMREYLTAVPRDLYLIGRITRFIEPTLAGGPIFHTSALAGREAQARANLAAEAEWLRAGAPDGPEATPSR